MYILFISPAVSNNYKAHVEAVARKGWRDKKFFKRDIKKNERIVGKSFYCLGLLTLASMLPKEVTFDFVDENFHAGGLKEALERNRYDLVAVTAQLIQSQRAREIIRFFSEREVHVVIGGSHPTTFADDYAGQGVSVVIGEGEERFAEFLTDFSARSPKPVYEADSLNCTDLNRSPMPDYALLSKNRYSLVGVQTTRGCPYRCRFCSVSRISGARYRHKPVEQVAEEVRQVKRYWPSSTFFFFDDNTFADRDYAFELFEALREVDLGNWIAHADISVSENEDLLELVGTNGNPFFSIGFETLSKENAESLGNRMKAGFRSRYEESIRKLQKKNIRVGGSFMFGFPGDSKETLEEITDFIRRNRIEAYITRYSALPGSALYDEVLEEYQRFHDSIACKGAKRVAVVNEYFMRKNGFSVHETEDRIVEALKKETTTELPMVAIDALATYRCFMG